MMRTLALILSFGLGSYAFAASNAAKDLLSKFETRDLNRRCAVKYENDVLSIVSLFESRASFQRYVTSIEVQSEDVLRLSHTDYDGTAEVYMVRKPHSLVVIGTWVDGENGFDASSFCELPIRE